VSELRFEQVQPTAPETSLHDWRHVHNLIIPTAPLSVPEVQERSQRNHLVVAYLDGVAVGNSTVRPPADHPATAIVIARVLADYRRRGYGEQLYQRALAKAYELGAAVIQTVVLESNDDGLRFAEKHGFVEIDRYVLPGDTIPFIDLRLVANSDEGGDRDSTGSANDRDDA
jgi:ribosomal protein S18 acetylase RimI-like enzyme